MSSDPQTPCPVPGRRPVVLALVLLLLLLSGLGLARYLMARAPVPVPPQITQQMTPAAPAGETPAAELAPATPSPAPAGTAAEREQQPLPPLVPGSPLTDDKFAQVSAEVVIAAMGLKKDKDWELNLMAYLDKQLKKAGLTIEQYNDYAVALHRQPDRARAVAENIMMRVEKKVGYRVTMDKLPMFKFDDATVKHLEEKLRQ